MISTPHLYRRSAGFVVFNGILRGSFLETGLRSEIGDVRQDSVRRESMLIYRKFLYKRAGEFEFIMEVTVLNTQLIRNISNFDSTDFATGRRILRAATW